MYFFYLFLEISKFSILLTVIGVRKGNSPCKRKGGENMGNTSDGKTIEHQFDCFCKTVLRNCARDIYDENRRRNNRHISLELLTQKELSQLSIFDDYDSDYICVDLYDYQVRIEDILIAQAIENLPKKKQDVILLSFFLNMTNADIGKLMNLAESTVHYHRANALKELRQIMEEHSDEIKQ